MCGLVATIGATPVDEGALGRALAAIRHRGPDGEGRILSPDRRVGLGHVRLALVDRAGGAQPIASRCPDGEGVVAVVTGELYDDDRLRRALAARGHRFTSRSDSEILVHLYEEAGEAALSSLRGEFAFVLWDGRARRLLAARDRFGVRPLCFTVDDRAGALHLASEAKALFALGVAPAWDEESLHQALSLQYHAPDRTLFRGVRQLAPGHLLRARVDERGRLAVETARYWDLAPPRLDEPDPARAYDATACDPAAAAAALRERLDEAVALRLRGDVPVACHLSGGVDSSAVAALAARRTPGPLACFTIAFPDDAAYDERALARATAAHLGADLHVVEAPADTLADSLAEAVFHGEGLSINGHLAAKLLLSRAVARAGFRVALTGEGADEVLCGYAHARRDLWLAEAAAGDEEAARRLALLDGTNRASAGIMLPLPDGATDGEGTPRPLPLDAVRRRLGHVPSFLVAKAGLGGRVHALLDAGFRARFADRDPGARFVDALDAGAALDGRHPVEQGLYLWMKSALAGYILRTLGDGMEMASAVEGRLPFLDHVLYAHVARLPLALKVRDGVEKRVLRDAVRPLLPAAVVDREKHPFVAPPLARADAPRFRALLHDTLLDAGRRLPFVDGAAVRRLLDRWPTLAPGEQQAQDPALFLLLTAALLGARMGL